MFDEKNILIQQLETISSLRNEALIVQKKMDTYKPIDKYERKIKVPKFPCETEFAIDHKSENALTLAKSMYSKAYEPQKPKLKKAKDPQTDTSRVTKHKKDKIVGFIIACFFGVISLPNIFQIFTGDILTGILNLIIFGICLFFIIKFLIKLVALKKEDENSTKNALIEYEQKKKEYEKEYNEELKEYETKLKSHNLLKEKFIEDYKNWRAIYLENLEEETKITEQLEQDKADAIKKIDDEELQPIIIKLAESMDGILSKNYLNSVDILIEYLKSGRADNLKEAIDVYEETLYRERELQILKEQEAQRQYEARREKESQRRCNYCAHSRNCNMKYSDGAYNCTAFYLQK